MTPTEEYCLLNWHPHGKSPGAELSFLNEWDFIKIKFPNSRADHWWIVDTQIRIQNTTSCRLLLVGLDINSTIFVSYFAFERFLSPVSSMKWLIGSLLIDSACDSMKAAREIYRISKPRSWRDFSLGSGGTFPMQGFTRFPPTVRTQELQSPL